MTEAEWLVSTDVQAMYVFLGDATTLFKTRWQGYRSVPRFAFGERKSRLFAVACCRRVMHLLPVEAARTLVEVAEQCANGLLGAEELRAAAEASERAWNDRVLFSGRVWRYQRDAIDAVSGLYRGGGAGRGGVMRACATALLWAAHHNQALGGQEPRDFLHAEHARQADLLRDTVGNPFRPRAVEPAWLAWNDRCVERMARGIYDERAFDRLPILHDALLDAGCDDEPILSHCRGAGPHVRGCWVIDLLLGKV